MAHMLSMFFTAIGQVLLIGLLVGAGLPALFSVGIRAMAYGTGGDAETGEVRGLEQPAELRGDVGIGDGGVESRHDLVAQGGGGVAAIRMG